MFHKIKEWIKSHYRNILGINDSPHRTALGLGLGVFLGNFPSMGPLAAVTAAFLFKANRAAALIGSLLTNTWMSLVTLGFSVQLGSLLRGSNQTEIHMQWQQFKTGLTWANLGSRLKEGPALEALGSVLLGYAIVSFVLGFFSYLVVFWILKHRKARLS